jgi:glycosyltransferase involved in cell wall biosynthesis
MTEPVHVLLDGFGLEDDSRHRGIGTYLRELILRTSTRDGVHVSVVTGDLDAVGWLPTSVQRNVARDWLPSRWRSIGRGLALPRVIASSSADVFHSPAQLPPRRSARPWVQTLHDLTPLVFDDPFFAAERRHWHRVGPRLRDAAVVICPSRSSANQAIDLLRVEPARVEVIPWGISDQFSPEGPVADRGDPYLLAVMSWGPHKGFSEACAVIGMLADAGYPHRLVVAGRQDPYGAERMREVVAAAPHPERIDLVGFVDDLPALYRGAAALVMTSRAEGFGLPVVEAFASGTPVVAFDNTSLPEVGGDGAVFVSDGDGAAMAAEVKHVIDDATAVRELRTAGLRRAADFSWDAAITGHVEAYARAAARR